MDDKTLVRALASYQMGKPTPELWNAASAFVINTTKSQILVDWNDVRFQLVSDFLEFVKYHRRKSVRWVLSVYKRRKTYAITAALLRVRGVGMDYDKWLRQGWNSFELGRIHKLIVFAKTCPPNADIPALFAAKEGMKEQGLTNVKQTWYHLQTAMRLAQPYDMFFDDGGERQGVSFFEL